jgi:hypothetical protein
MSAELFAQIGNEMSAMVRINKIGVTGAAGRIAYSFNLLLCDGSVSARTSRLNLDSVTLRPQATGSRVF